VTSGSFSTSTLTSYTTIWQTSTITDDGDDPFIDPKCVVEGTEVNISTTQKLPVEQLYPNHSILTKDCPFNTDDVDALKTITSNNIDGDKSIQSILGLYRFDAIGIWIINDGLLKTTEEHLHVIKRDGLWQVKNTNELQIGDVFLNINDEEIEITSLVLDSVNTYKVWKVDVEPNDVFYANGILTHNFKIAP
jgi:hypothetical protein